MNWLPDRFYILAGIMDASLIAGSGFLINLLSGRFLSTEKYGLFVTLYTIASFSMIFQSALISGPYTVLSQSIQNQDRGSYFTGTLLMTAMLGLGLGMASSLGSIAYLSKSEQLLSFLPLFSAYIFFNLLQEFMRRYFYSVQRESQALLLDLISYGGQVIAVLLAGYTLNLNYLFFLMAATSFLALAFCGFVNRREILALMLPITITDTIWNTICKNWDFGRWILFSSGVSWVANQFYVLALGLFHPAPVVAQLGAARTLASVSNPLVLAYESIGMPRITNTLSSKGVSAVKHYVVISVVLGGSAFALLGVMFFVFPLQTIEWIYGKSFGDISLLVRVFSLLPMLWFVGKVFSIALLCIKQPRALFPVYVTACLFTISIGIWMTAQLGALGAGLGFLLNAIILSLGFGFQFFKISTTLELEKSKKVKT